MRTPRAPAWVYLEMDGGWLTAEGIAMGTGMSVHSVYRSMWRWHRSGHVASRQVELAFVGGVNMGGRNRSGHLEVRREWKTIRRRTP